MQNILQQLLTPMNIFFGLFMLGLFIYSCIKIFLKPKESTTIPNLIAAIGIIGTFAGIFMGLLDFDTTKLDDSIPKLLDGMKTAFATSLIGLVLSNILKCIQSGNIKREAKKLGKDNSDVSLEKIASLMFDIKETIVNSNLELVSSIRDIKENTIKVSEENQVAMKSLVEELVGDKEESLVGQMKNLRESLVKAQDEAQKRLNSGLEKMGTQLDNLVKTNNAISNEIERGNNVLIDEFRIFAKNMAENNMKAFTEAIQECIRDLNNQLQEQFGENFQHLNLAVEKLLEWQIHYKETIEKTNRNQEEIYTGMTMAKDLVIEINNRSQSIVEVANKLGDKIITFDTQQQNLNSSIEILNKISYEAKDLIPNIDVYLKEMKNRTLESTKNIESYITDVDSKLLEHTVLATNKITDHVVTITEKSIVEVNKSSLNVLDKINTVNQEAIKNISKLSDYFEEQSSASINHINSIQDSMKLTASSLLETLTRVSSNTSKNINENNTQIISVRNAINELTQVSTDNIKKQQNEIIIALKDLTTGVKATSELNIKAMEDQISSIEKAVVKFENEGFTLTKKISDNIQIMVENNNTNLQTSVNNLNEALGATLNTSLQSLGEQLAAVSEKFVSDYTPLTLELQKVVNLAKRVG
ncbi:MAG: hypothetical protein ACRDDH_20890 [Cetobacterium sp.]|uniref:hypothetical protein n=1 Tax=Cetobacterium sp. TaxID=2071632 RepID=UPI003EE6356B